MSDVDAACDQALAASKLAHTTHDDAHHKAAKEAHENAFGHAKMNERPSLAQTHLQAAALHDKHADPTTPEGKSSAAFRASKKAKASPSPDTHDAAASAHQDASAAHAEGGNGKLAMVHSNTGYEHSNSAARMRAPKPGNVIG